MIDFGLEGKSDVLPDGGRYVKQRLSRLDLLLTLEVTFDGVDDDIPITTRDLVD